jgi:hypothetical protein
MMKKMVWLMVIALAVVLAFTACGGEDGGGGGDDDDGDGDPELDFTNYTTAGSYALRVRNNSGKRLVAFKDELKDDKLIGGITASGLHGLEKKAALFTTSEGFALILITEEQYNANKANLQALRQTPFTRLFAFFNAKGTNETIYEVSGRMGGNCTIEIQNQSPLDVELRLNEMTGDTLGFARAESQRTQLYVNPGDYTIFPVFIKYNAYRDEVITVYLRDASGVPYSTQQQLSAGGGSQSELSVNVTQILQNTEFSTGTAWLIIDNQATDTGVQLQRGDVIQRTSTGTATINNGYSRNFQINMEKGGDGKYAASVNINAYTVGRTEQKFPIGNHDLEVDKVYKVTVTGSFTGGTAAVSAPVFQNNVDLSAFSTSP